MSDETILDAFRHSEVDDPTTTHPVLYQKIEALSLLWKSYAETIGTDARKVDELAERVRREFEKEQEHAKTMKDRPILREFPSYWSEYKGGSYDPALEVDTGVAPELLREISERITNGSGEEICILFRRGRGSWNALRAPGISSGCKRNPPTWGTVFHAAASSAGGRQPAHSVGQALRQRQPRDGFRVKAHSIEQAALLALAFAGHERAPRRSGQPAVQET